MTHFRAGDQVVCIDASNTERYMPRGLFPVGGLDGLREGTVYTVVGIEVHAGLTNLVLAEIKRSVPPIINCVHFEGFAAERFRRVVKQTYDLTIFQRILQKQGAPV